MPSGSDKLREIDEYIASLKQPNSPPTTSTMEGFDTGTSASPTQLTVNPQSTPTGPTERDPYHTVAPPIAAQQDLLTATPQSRLDEVRKYMNDNNLTHEPVDFEDKTFSQKIPSLGVNPSNTTYQDVMRVAGGMNHAIASGLSIPPEVTNDILSIMGIGFMQPGDATKAIKTEMRSLGIRVDELDNLEAMIGSELFKGLVGTNALIAAAPRLAAQTGGHWYDLLTKGIGELSKKFPVLANIGEFGAAPGGVLAKEHIGPGAGAWGDMGTIAGSMGGAMAATSVTGLVRVGAKGTLSATKAITDVNTWPGADLVKTWLGVKDPTASMDPLRHPSLDLTRTELRTYTESQITGDRLRIEDAIVRSVNSIPLHGTSAQLQTNVRKHMEAARSLGEKIESSYWERTPLKEPIPMNDVRKQVNQLEADLKDKDFVRPQDFIDRLKELSSPSRDPETGKMTKALPTIEKIRDFRKEIMASIRNEEGGYVTGRDVNTELNANRYKLITMLNSAIEAALPGDVSIKQANAASKMYHDIFTRGPFNDILMQTRQGAEKVPPEQTVEALMKHFKGLSEVMTVKNTLGNYPHPDNPSVFGQQSTGRSAASALDKAQLNAMQKETEDAIRAMWRESVADKGPEYAEKFLEKNKKVFSELAPVYNQLQASTHQINALLAEKELINKSAFAKFLQVEDPAKVIRDIFNSNKNVRAEIGAIRNHLKGSPEASQAFQDGIIDEIIIRGKADPKRLQNVLNDATIRDVLDQNVAPDVAARFRKIVGAANSIAKGDEELRIGNLAVGVNILSRIAGAQLGQEVAHLAGGGTIQTPSIMSQTFLKASEKLFSNTPVDKLMRLAITDPAWEKILLARAPTSTHDMRKLGREMRRLVGGLDGLRQSDLIEHAQETALEIGMAP